MLNNYQPTRPLPRDIVIDMPVGNPPSSVAIPVAIGGSRYDFLSVIPLFLSGQKVRAFSHLPKKRIQNFNHHIISSTTFASQNMNNIFIIFQKNAITYVLFPAEMESRQRSA